MALTFNDGQNNEFFTILNLFKTEDENVHALAYNLLNRRLEKMGLLTLNHNYFADFVRNLKQYLQTVDHIPGQVDCNIYNLFGNVIHNNKMVIEKMKSEKSTLETRLQSLTMTNTRLEGEKQKLSEMLETSMKTNLELKEEKKNLQADLDLEFLRNERSQS